MDDAAPRVAALHAGACVAWALPPSQFPTAAQHRVQPVVAGLGLPPVLADAVLLGLSELATNAARHDGGPEEDEPVAGLPEVWLYIRQTAPAGGHELVVTVFRAGGWDEEIPVPEPGDQDATRQSGRGLQVVAALAAAAGGRCDRHPSRSRLGPRVPGTAVWLALPLPACPQRPAPVTPAAAEAIDRLAVHLNSRGIKNLITSAGTHEALLSCPTGLTVWARNGAYRWETANGPQHRQLTDLVDVAEQVLAETERPIRPVTRPADGTTGPLDRPGAQPSRARRSKRCNAFRFPSNPRPRRPRI